MISVDSPWKRKFFHAAIFDMLPCRYSEQQVYKKEHSISLILCNFFNAYEKAFDILTNASDVFRKLST